jgi:phosphoserine phosphatase
MKKLIVFDLDGTLAESKASLDLEMANLLNALLEVVKVAESFTFAHLRDQVLPIRKRMEPALLGGLHGR